MKFMMWAAVVALAPVLSAQAGSGVSPFAGTYEWTYPNFGYPNVTISDNGNISGSYSDGRLKTIISGRVRSDGRYSFTVTRTEYVDDVPKHGPSYRTYRFDYSGTLSLDDAGNIAAASDGPAASFVLVRQ